MTGLLLTACGAATLPTVTATPTPSPTRAATSTAPIPTFPVSTPLISLTADPATGGIAPVTVMFRLVLNTGITGSLSTVCYENDSIFDFGDNASEMRPTHGCPALPNPATPTPTLLPQTMITANHQYQQPGIYHARASVKTASGALMAETIVSIQ